MPKPKYSFEKRQREIAKKKKQEAKETRRRESRAADPGTLDAEAAAEPAQPPAPAPEPDVAAPRVHLRKTSGH